ncbi:MAG: hypothetical protein FJW39_15950 [Acidobacteria bacterium]|nr:hypothetical protein [Acidobacteriota bacterium]
MQTITKRDLDGPFHKHVYFHATAAGLSVKITRDGQAQIRDVNTVLAPALVPPTGGKSHSSAQPVPGLARFVSFASAEAWVDGEEGERGSAVTNAQASVKGLKVINRPSAHDNLPGVATVELTASSIAVSMRSTLAAGAKVPRFEFVSAPVWAGVVIQVGPSRISIVPEVDTGLMAAVTMSKLDSLLNKAKFKAAIQGRIVLTRHGEQRTSIVSKLNVNGTPINGHVFTQPGLGRLTFGEIVIGDNIRKFTMLRIQLGCEVFGDINVDPIVINGEGK